LNSKLYLNSNFVCCFRNRVEEERKPETKPTHSSPTQLEAQPAALFSFPTLSPTWLPSPPTQYSLLHRRLTSAGPAARSLRAVLFDPTPLICPLDLQSSHAPFALGQTTREALHGRPPHSAIPLSLGLRRTAADPPLHHHSPSSTHLRSSLHGNEPSRAQLPP